MDCLTPPQSQLRVIIIMPVHNDWTSAAELIRRIDKSVSSLAHRIEIVLVDDGSIQTCERSMIPASLSAVRAIRLLRLRRNLGHQRAIAIGLMHVNEMIGCDAIVVMDADGEDTPEGVVQLIDAYSSHGGTTAIFAERSRRLESLQFQLFYLFYKILHRSLTGVSVRVGNFSILPTHYLPALGVMSELWNHYAAAIFHSKLPFIMIPIPRGHRIAGTSQMNFVGLVSHGLSAISVFGDIVGVRLLLGSLTGALLAGLGIVAVLIVRLFTNWAIPGWATYATGLLAIILIQFIAVATAFTFIVLSNRATFGFLPTRDYGSFVAEIVDLYSHE
jgi:polyisoprenyl-phosphate glycosyltransferase